MIKFWWILEWRNHCRWQRRICSTVLSALQAEGVLLSQTGVEFSSWKWKSAFCTSSTLCTCDIPSRSQAALNRWQERQQILIPEHIEVLEHDIYTINAWVLTLERQSVSGMIQMMTILVIHDLNPNGASSINSQISNLGKNCLNCPVST